ncbi:MAG: helix-turn-helix domain-containing protein [Solirubrobacteraceae bacterium]
MTKHTSLGQLLRNRREHLGYSRTRAAQLSGVNASSIEAWELGRVSKPPIHDVLRLARVLSIPIDELERSVLEEADIAGADGSGAAPAALPRERADVGLVGLPLFDRAVTLMCWSDADAASALNTSPERVAGLRRGDGELSVLEVLTLIAMTAAFPSGRGGASQSEVDDLLARLRGASV